MHALKEKIKDKTSAGKEKEMAKEGAKAEKHEIEARHHQAKAEHQAAQAGLHRVPLTGPHDRQPVGAAPSEAPDASASLDPTASIYPAAPGPAPNVGKYL